MVIVCAWCQKYMGSREPFHDPAVSHGICDDCLDRQLLDDAPVLVVSRHRQAAIPMLQTLLRGAPEIRVVVDRRGEERRSSNGRGNGHGRPGASVVDRRASERRRAPSFYLV
jgi:hypothetical protein